MPQKSLCVATQHDLRKTLPRSSIKKFFGSFFQKRTEKCFFVTFFQKVAYPHCNFLQAISFAQTLRLLTEQQIIGFRAACPMARKPLCVATQHDLRRVLLRSAIKKLFGSFSRKRTETPFSVTFFKKWQVHKF